MPRSNPDKIMATLHTYKSPAGKCFPVLMIEKPGNTGNGKAICVPIGHMHMEIAPSMLTLGVVFN